LVEEAAAAAESLLSQAAQLATNVGQFKLDDNYQHVQASLPHSAPKTKMISHAKNTLPKRNAIKPSQPKDDEWESF
jgi:methyl-accepting chemotaxis protein